MKYLRASILLLILICTLQHTVAQMSISGTVRAEDEEPIPFANVLLLNPVDSSLVSGTLTGQDGSFSLTASTGDFLLNLSMVGYRPAYFLLIMSNTKNTLPLGDIYLKEDATQLEEVVVTAHRPLYDKEPGKTIINVQNSITAAGSTALEVLEKSPGVIVNRMNGSIGMNGKNNVLVMINGKVNRLPMDAVMQMLEGISSASIDKIELITLPDAKHEAEGDAGIIHIVMGESPDLGTSGNFAVNPGYARAESLGGSLNLNRRGRHLGAFLNYSVQRDRNKHKWLSEHFTTKYGFIQTNISDSDRRPLTTVQNLRAGMEYNFNSRTSASILLTGYRRKWDLDAETTNVHIIKEDSMRRTEMSIAEINQWQSASASIGLRHQLNSQQQISVSFDYLNYDNDNPSSYDNRTFVNDSYESLRELVAVEKVTPIRFRIANLDYTNILNEGLTIDAGTKVTLSQFANHVAVDRSIEGVVETDPELTNSSTLDEGILAAYATWRWNPGGQWSVDGGVRYEHTTSYLTTPSDGVLIDRSFGNFFPSLFVTRNLGETGKIRLAYGRRITRPTFNDMAPFVFYIGPGTFVSGNLSLRPAITDAVDVSYQFNQWWVSLKYSYAKDEIALFQPEFNPETNEQIFRSQNIRFMRTYGASATFPVQLTHWWEMQNDISFYNHRYESQYRADHVARNLNRVVLNTTSSFILPANFSIELSGAYQSALVWGLSVFEPSLQLHLGVKKKLRNEGVITLTFNDMLNGLAWRIKTNLPEANTRSYTRYDWGTRSINLTYTYTFGNTRLKSVDVRSGSQAERERVQ